MANQHFIVKRNITVPNTDSTYWGVWVCDTDAGKPSSGLVPGELGIMLDQDLFYIADSTTTWVRVATESAVGGPFLSYDDWTFEGDTVFNGTVDFDGAVNLPATVLSSGVYTPTLYNTTNVSASTAISSQYLRVGSTCTVSGYLNIDPTLTATSTVLGISLPIASDFSDGGQCGGTAAAIAIAGLSAGIYADVTNNRATLQFVASDINNATYCFSFTYRII